MPGSSAWVPSLLTTPDTWHKSSAAPVSPCSRWGIRGVTQFDYLRRELPSGGDFYSLLARKWMQSSSSPCSLPKEGCIHTACQFRRLSLPISSCKQVVSSYDSLFMLTSTLSKLDAIPWHLLYLTLPVSWCLHRVSLILDIILVRVS